MATASHRNYGDPINRDVSTRTRIIGSFFCYSFLPFTTAPDDEQEKTILYTAAHPFKQPTNPRTIWFFAATNDVDDLQNRSSRLSVWGISIQVIHPLKPTMPLRTENFWLIKEGEVLTYIPHSITQRSPGRPELFTASNSRLLFNFPEIISHHLSEWRPNEFPSWDNIQGMNLPHWMIIITG